MLGLFACAIAGILVPSSLAGGYQDRTPLPKDVSGTGTTASTSISSGTGSAALHMLIGLAVVLALIFALYKLLKRTGRGGGAAGVSDDGFMSVVSSTPLGPTRSLHLVNVGEDLVLIGASEQSITPIRVYSRDEARRLGVELEADASVRGTQPSSFLEALRRMTTR